jgi:hypothetical protein
MIVHLLDIEWLLSTLFDASLFNFRAAGNGGSFFCFVPFRVRSWRRAYCGARRNAPDAAKRSPSVLEIVAGRQLCLHVRSSGAGHGGGVRAILSPEWRKTKNFLFRSVAWGV